MRAMFCAPVFDKASAIFGGNAGGVVGRSKQFGGNDFARLLLQRGLVPHCSDSRGTFSEPLVKKLIISSS